MSDSTERIEVRLSLRSYEIRIVSGGLGELGAFVRERVSGDAAFIVTDRHVEHYADAAGRSLRSAGFRIEAAVLEAGEKTKSLGHASQLYDRLVEFGADRRTAVVAVGGGVVGDLAGFVAATLARGIPLVQVPTTLLAQVDSSVGGKVAVNHPKGKNLIGAFHQPAGVFIDTAVLDTLPSLEYGCGLAEVVKYGAALDADFFAFLEAHVEAIDRRDPDVLRRIIAHCCRLKAGIVERDEREESGLRAVLNYGHTFAHAFETLTGYDALRHGEAVALGMVCASTLAERLGRIDRQATARQIALLERLGLPTRWTGAPLDAGMVLQAMRRDKKAAAGRLRFVLLARLGRAELVEDVPDADVRAVLQALSQ